MQKQTKDKFYHRNKDLLEELSQFKTTDEFNDYTCQIYYTYKDELKTNLKEFTIFLSQYSVFVPGVSWMKVERMAKNFGKSVPTIKRYLRELKKLGIIKRVKPTIGSHHITYFNRDISLAELPSKKKADTPDDTPKMIHQENDETPCESKSESQFSTQETHTFKANLKSKNLNKRYKDVDGSQNDTPQQLDPTYIPDWVDPQFVEVVKPFFTDAQKITALWTKATYAARNLGLCGKYESPKDITKIAIESFKTAIYRNKRRAIKGSLFGYYYGILCNKIKDYKQKLERKLVEYDFIDDGIEEYQEPDAESTKRPSKEPESISDREIKLFIERNYYVKGTSLDVVRDLLFARGVEWDRALRLVRDVVVVPSIGV